MGSKAFMVEIEGQLPSRTELDLIETAPLERAAEKYADQRIAVGKLQSDRRADLIVALVRAGAYYLLGCEMSDAIKDNKARAKVWHRAGNQEIAGMLKVPSRGRPVRLGEQALIYIMTHAWKYFGLNPGTAYGRGTGHEESPFQQICNGWIKAIEDIPEYRNQPGAFVRLPVRSRTRQQRPSRSVYRQVKKRRTD